MRFDLAKTACSFCEQRGSAFLIKSILWIPLKKEHGQCLHVIVSVLTYETFMLQSGITICVQITQLDTFKLRAVLASILPINFCIFTCHLTLLVRFRESLG